MNGHFLPQFIADRCLKSYSAWEAGSAFLSPDPALCFPGSRQDRGRPGIEHRSLITWKGLCVDLSRLCHSSSQLIDQFSCGHHGRGPEVLFSSENQDKLFMRFYRFRHWLLNRLFFSNCTLPIFSFLEFMAISPYNIFWYLYAGRNGKIKIEWKY